LVTDFLFLFKLLTNETRCQIVSSTRESEKTYGFAHNSLSPFKHLFNHESSIIFIQSLYLTFFFTPIIIHGNYLLFFAMNLCSLFFSYYTLGIHVFSLFTFSNGLLSVLPRFLIRSLIPFLSLSCFSLSLYCTTWVVIHSFFCALCYLLLSLFDILEFSSSTSLLTLHWFTWHNLYLRLLAFYCLFYCLPLLEHTTIILVLLCTSLTRTSSTIFVRSHSSLGLA
jgi:hypothetical protein